MIKPGWKHPEEWNRYQNKFTPIGLFDYKFSDMLKEWEKEKAEWDRGYVQNYTPDLNGYTYVKKEESKYYEDGSTFEDWHGEKPIVGHYMPEWAPGEATLFCMYETTSEGTPISPCFETPEQLARWLADNKASAFGDITATYDQWLAMIKRGSSAASMAITDDGQMISGVEAISR